MIQFTKATKSQAKLRAALFGPSGSGKTFSALRMATGLAEPGGRIALIDTERRSASKYADRFRFDVCDLQERNIEDYTAAMESAGQAGYGVLVIDSLTHAWQELLNEIQRISNSPRYKQNTWAAWSEGTPKQRALVEALLAYPGHVIATIRSKTEWSIQKDEKSGRTSPVRVGLAPEQGKGIEYEFDLLMELSTDHIANIIKDRTGRFQDKVIACPDEDFGRELSMWLSEGKAQEQPSAPVHDTQNTQPAVDRAVEQLAEELDDAGPQNHSARIAELNALILKHGLTGKRRAWQEHFGVRELTELNDGQLDKLIVGIHAKYETQTAGV